MFNHVTKQGKQHSEQHSKQHSKQQSKQQDPLMYYRDWQLRVALSIGLWNPYYEEPIRLYYIVAKILSNKQFDIKNPIRIHRWFKNKGLVQLVWTRECYADELKPTRRTPEHFNILVWTKYDWNKSHLKNTSFTGPLYVQEVEEKTKHARNTWKYIWKENNYRDFLPNVDFGYYKSGVNLDGSPYWNDSIQYFS